MNNKERFEELLSKASERHGFDGLMNYIHKSDFYTAPASTKFHHDLCKTNFYETEMRNQKTYDPEKVKAAAAWQVKKDNAGQFIWESVPTYVVNDKNPYGHGEKSVMMIEEFMKLTMEERYAIRWHMGMGDCTYNEVQAFNKSCEKFPLVFLVHIADQEASHFMEDIQENRELFQEQEIPADEFQEAEPV